MNRFLFSLTAVTFMHSAGIRAESYVPWNKGRVLDERADLCVILEKEIKERSERLSRENGTPFTVQYQFPAGDERVQKKFSDRWLAKKFDEGDVAGRWEDLLRLAGELSVREAEARPTWQEKMKDAKASAEEKEGNIYGTKIKARKLGAILDNSPSMAKYLPALRKEIRQTFEDFPNVEIWGSFLNRFYLSQVGGGAKALEPAKIPATPDWNSSTGNTWVDTRWYTMVPGDADNPFDPAWHFPATVPSSEERLHIYSIMMERDNVSALLGMVELHKVDALYWFCDLKDEVNDDAVKRIAQVITKSKAALYVHTVGRKPKGLLEQLVKLSGGRIITQKPRIIPAEKEVK